MAQFRPAVVGIGATGSVLAAAVLTQIPDATLVVSRPTAAATLREHGLQVSGALSFRVPVRHVVAGMDALRDLKPDLIFLCTKTFHLAPVLAELRGAVRPGHTAVVSCHNGLGTEDLVAEAFGAASAFRLSLNYGAATAGPGHSEVAFFNPPNPLGALTPDNRGRGAAIAQLLTDGGLATEAVDDIQRAVWKKMVLKCTMASICAVADMTIREALDYPPTREIADACFQEALAVARARGYDLGEDYLDQAIGYLARVGVHKDSMCHDIEAGRPTEIEFLGGRVVQYGRDRGIPTPYYVAMTNMVRAVEQRARARAQDAG
ncbi:MAG: 2-dehydropantoate 2-reductase [Deferrisomatales bacterium]|nr:2-dehydropantoate 2-reductase [Deferrisomatales bacterium]